jgi:hypothetical protein
MTSLTAYRKSLEGVNFKQAIITIAVLTFIYKIGIAGKLAKFGLDVLSEIGSNHPSIPSSNPISPFEGMVEKLKVLNNVMENALSLDILTLGTLVMAANVFKIKLLSVKSSRTIS